VKFEELIYDMLIPVLFGFKEKNRDHLHVSLLWKLLQKIIQN